MKINKEFTDVHCCYEFIITYILYFLYYIHNPPHGRSHSELSA